MVVFYLRNSKLGDTKVVPVTVSLVNDVLQDTLSIPTASGFIFPNKVDLEGEEVWVLTLSTTEKDSNGDLIEPEFVNIISKDTVLQELELALGRLGEKIDWGVPLPDIRPPRIFSITPSLDQITNVDIDTDIEVRLKEDLPAAGIDLSTVLMRVNNFAVISGGVSIPGFDTRITGNIFDLTLRYNPKIFD
jgi:hypothetical protein